MRSKGQEKLICINCGTPDTSGDFRAAGQKYLLGRCVACGYMHRAGKAAPDAWLRRKARMAA